MGGIFAIVSKVRRRLAEEIAIGLRRLRHRGEDCAGIAIVTDGELVVRKDRGTVDEVFERYKVYELEGFIGLGHTRFSTHGRAHYENAHPHTDCRNRIAVAGDGVIANYEDLRDNLIVRGHSFVSRSDFEVVPHLIEDHAAHGRSLIEAAIETAKALNGVFSVAILSLDHRALVAFTKIQPLYIGIAQDSLYVSSTASALYGFADRYIELGDGEVAYLSENGFEVYSIDTSSRVEKPIRKLEVDEKLIEKDGFPHFMLREIYEVPYAILRAAMVLQKRYLSLAARLISSARNLYVIANGSSLHAGYIASYYLAELVGVSPIVLSAAEFPLYHVENVGPGTVVMAISQSGETGDVLRAIYEAKLRGATILGITNNVNSRLAQLSSLFLPIGAGPELAVPATKTFVATLVSLYMVSLKTAEYIGKLSASELNEAVDDLKKLALDLRSSIPHIDAQTKLVAKKIAKHAKKSGYSISRGINYPLALETALKFKEAAYMHIEGIEAGEFRHGPITLVDEGFITIFIMPAEPAAAKATFPLIKDAYERKAIVTVVTDEDTATLIDVDVNKLIAPSTRRHLKPMASIVPVQLLAYHLGVERGCPIDRPKKLVKAVVTPA